MHKITLLFSLLIISITIHAQQKLSGVVTEKNTGTPVPFATVQSKNAKSTLTNGSGEFEIDVPELPAGITVSHLNYEAVTLKSVSCDLKSCQPGCSVKNSSYSKGSYTERSFSWEPGCGDHAGSK
jgi:hypothetical protein